MSRFLKITCRVFRTCNLVFFVINKNNGDDKSIARKPEQEQKIKEVYGICLKYCRGNEKNDERNIKF